MMTRSLLTLLVVIVGVWSVTAAQVMPTSDGGCSVSADGMMSCEWLGTTPDVPKAASQQADDATRAFAAHPQSGLFVTRLSLAARAPVTLPLATYDALVVGLNDGILINETTKPAGARIKVSKGSVMLVPKNERMKFRNDSGQNLELVVIENR
jgi:hypothetical protein